MTLDRVRGENTRNLIMIMNINVIQLTFGPIELIYPIKVHQRWLSLLFSIHLSVVPHLFENIGFVLKLFDSTLTFNNISSSFFV